MMSILEQKGIVFSRRDAGTQSLAEVRSGFSARLSVSARVDPIAAEGRTRQLRTDSSSFSGRHQHRPAGLALHERIGACPRRIYTLIVDLRAQLMKRQQKGFICVAALSH
jgi:hypothetical protein